MRRWRRRAWTEETETNRVAGPARTSTTVYGLAVLAGAILVFQVQPIAGRFLLPAFGGGAAVWTACLFFFQTMLLGGYAYAHWLTTSLDPRRQAVLHAVLLGVSLFFLPLRFTVADVPGDRPAWIWTSLLLALGFPFVMLASTAPLLQRWSSLTAPSRSPYRLYALSNFGALLALLTYPLLIEANMRLAVQAIAWSVGYVAFVLTSIAACRLIWRRCDPQAGSEFSAAAFPGGPPATGWTPVNAVVSLLLAGAAVVMLLAVTNQLTQNVAPIPFLWILPLVVYLLSYIVCFGGVRWYDRAIWGSLFVVSFSCLVILEFFATSFAIIPVVTCYLVVLFCICMLCHGELYRLRPPPERLSHYYLLIALGGALGGGFVSLLAPVIFDRYWEGLAGAYIVYLLFGFVGLRDIRSSPGKPSQNAASALQAAIETWGRRLFAVGWIAGVFLFPAIIVVLGNLMPAYDVASLRNFYGVLNVRDVTGDGRPRRVLIDGTTIHGYQLHGDDRMAPTSYYGHHTGIGLLFESFRRQRELDVGVVGLGVGTLAGYGEAGDRLRFYELNPAVVSVARQHFSFLEESSATMDVVVGDARISLQKELVRGGSRNYDLLVVDAFSSDAIPVHLLTREAQRLYWSHLAPDGVLAFHVTNNYLDLAPVVADVAAEFGKAAVLLTTPSEIAVSSVADWVVLADDLAFFDDVRRRGVEVRYLARRDRSRVWTDDFSDLLDTIR